MAMPKRSAISNPVVVTCIAVRHTTWMRSSSQRMSWIVSTVSPRPTSFGAWRAPSSTALANFYLELGAGRADRACITSRKDHGVPRSWGGRLLVEGRPPDHAAPERRMVGDETTARCSVLALQLDPVARQQHYQRLQRKGGCEGDVGHRLRMRRTGCWRLLARPDRWCRRC